MRTLYHPRRDEISLPAVLYALSDPTRLAIIVELSSKKECAGATFEWVGPKSTRSYHFRVLREAGLTKVRSAGTQRFAALRRDDLNDRFPGLLKAILAAAEIDDAEPPPSAKRAAKR